MEMDDTGVSVGPADRATLYRRPTVTAIESGSGAAGSDDFDSSALVSQMYVDRDDLCAGSWTRWAAGTRSACERSWPGLPWSRDWPSWWATSR